MQITDKVALVTGAGSGIGRAVAIEASRRGMAVALVGRRTACLLATREALSAGTNSLVLSGDVTLPDDRRAMRDAVARRWGRLDVLVNNAGIVAAGPLAEADDAALERLCATNIVAPLALTREMLGLLGAANPGRVVNVGSVLGDVAYPLFAAYSASKFALRGASSALRRELAGEGIGVTYVAPRGARTGATRAIARYVAPLEMKLDSAETIARALWDAVAHDRTTAYPGLRERAFVLAERLFPGLIDRALASQLANAAAATREDEIAAGETAAVRDANANA